MKVRIEYFNFMSQCLNSIDLLGNNIYQGFPYYPSIKIYINETDLSLSLSLSESFKEINKLDKKGIPRK